MHSDGSARFGNCEVCLVGGYWRRLGDGREDRAYEPPRGVRDMYNDQLYTWCKAVYNES